MAVLAVLLASLVPMASLAGERARVRRAEVDVLERTVKLPAGAYPLDTYARYYSVETVSNRAFIKGSFVWHGRDPAGRYFQSSSPDIADGGCTVVTVFFDIKTNRVAGTFCNGLA